MIDKYAEINNRVLLYNACKGILRVKTAGSLLKNLKGGLAVTSDLVTLAGGISDAYHGIANRGAVNKPENAIPDDQSARIAKLEKQLSELQQSKQAPVEAPPKKEITVVPNPTNIPISGAAVINKTVNKVLNNV